MNPATQDDEAAWVFEPTWNEPPPRRRGPDRRTLLGVLGALAVVALLVGAALTWSGSDRSARVSTSPGASHGSSAKAAASSAAASSAASASAAPSSAAASAGASVSATGSVVAPSGVAPSGVAPSAVAPSPRVVMCPDAALAGGVLPDTPSRRHVPWKGIAGATVMFTNVGSTPCWLRGYPGVGFYNDEVMVSSISEPGAIGDERAEPTRVVLQPGQSAYSEIFWWAEDKDTIGVQRVSLIAPDHRTRLYADVRWSQSIDSDRIDVGPLTLTLAPDPGPGPAS